MLKNRWRPIVTLAMTPPGIEVEIKSVLFDLVRSRCAQLELEEGMLVMPVGTSLAFVEVEKPNGEVVRVERTYASFIEVEERAADAPRFMRDRPGSGRCRKPQAPEISAA